MLRRDGEHMKNSWNESLHSGCYFGCGYTGQFCPAQIAFKWPDFEFPICSGGLRPPKTTLKERRYNSFQVAMLPTALLHAL
jgi:hypothetical protein